MKSILAFIGTFLLIFGLGRDCCAAEISVDPLENVVQTGEGHYTCEYDDVSHDFFVDLSEEPEGSALIIALHGYGSSAESFRRDTLLHETVNPEGYTVVYVSGAPDPTDRTAAPGWNYEGKAAGNRDLEFLISLAAYIGQIYHTDTGRCYVVGFSNGAFMCHRLALEAADVFKGVISVSGTMPLQVWEKRTGTAASSLLQITGEKDETIPKNSDGSARYSRAPAIEDVIGYYADVNSLDIIEKRKEGKDSLLTKYSGASSERVVWHVVIKDGRHTWSAGNVTGIDTAGLILDFLETQRPA